jgi:hypothetical protein
MKLYTTQKHLTFFGLIVLASGTIISGILLGILAYYISNLFYLLLVFPLIVGGAAVFVYNKIAEFSKIRFTLITTIMGFLMGAIVALAFYGTPYLETRNSVINNFQKKYGIDAQTASKGFDNILIKETGSSGLVGFMKLRAQEGDTYTSYFIINSVPVHESKFTLQSTAAWAYWIIEVILMAFPSTLLGFFAGRRHFNQSANNWYDWDAISPKQIGSISLENKEKLLELLKANNLLRISELLVPEGAIEHPLIEVYEQRCKNKKGDILFIIKQTARINPTKVKRSMLSQWEVPPQEYAFFDNAIKRELQA